MTLAGQLLVATPSLTDPHFDRTVVLLVAHEDDGALGVVLNRALEVPVTTVLPQWAPLVGEPSTVFEGGPVSPEAAICLATVKSGDPPSGWQPVDGRLGTVDLSGEPDALAPYVEEMRIFAGYAGWGAGQLEMEVGAGAWFVVDRLPGDPFAVQPQALWPMVLRRQGGLMAAVATFPADPALN